MKFALCSRSYVHVQISYNCLMAVITTPRKWTLVKYTKREVDVRIRSVGAEIEIVALKGKPDISDAGFWIGDGETATVPMVPYEYLYVRGGQRNKREPTIEVDE